MDSFTLHPEEISFLLEKLCVDLGFCLPPNIIMQFQQAPPTDIDSFTEAILTAEGLNIQLIDQHLHKKVYAIVADVFRRHNN